MPHDVEQANEHTKLLYHAANDRRLSAITHQDEVASLISSHISKDEQALSANPVGERLPYNDYTTIDWLHDLVCNAPDCELSAENYTGQKLISIPLHPLWQEHTSETALGIRIMFWMDRHCSNWDFYGHRSFPGRYRYGHSK